MDTITRIATPDDAAVLLDIYAPYVRETAITFEWVVPGVEEFAERIRCTLADYPYLVAERDGRIIGYAYTGRFGVRKSYDWCAETSIYIAQGERGQGVGRALYEALEIISRKQNITRLMAILKFRRVLFRSSDAREPRLPRAHGLRPGWAHAEPGLQVRPLVWRLLLREDHRQDKDAAARFHPVLPARARGR